jgi:ribosome-associated translation inhibitor RaiA
MSNAGASRMPDTRLASFVLQSEDKRTQRCRMEHVDVTFRNMETSDWLDHEIRERVAKLESLCTDIVSCRVMIDKPHHHSQAGGRRFSVHIDLTVPGEEIAVSHSPHSRKLSEDGLRRDVMLVVRHAFASAKRQLQDYVRRRRREVKAHTNGRLAAAHT